MDIIKVAGAGILTAVVYALVRQIKPEIAPLVIMGGAVVILLSVADKFAYLTGTVDEMMELSGIKKENVAILVKAMGVCVVSQFAADICYDNSCSAIGSAVELAGKIGAVILAMPMLQSVALLALGLME